MNIVFFSDTFVFDTFNMYETTMVQIKNISRTDIRRQMTAKKTQAAEKLHRAKISVDVLFTKVISVQVSTEKL